MQGYSRGVALNKMMDYQIPKDSKKTSNWPANIFIKMLYESWEGESKATKGDQENMH